MGGMDDIRPYCQFGEINVYADPLARQGMLQMLPYCFAEHRYPGVPAIQLHEIYPHVSFRIGDIDIMPFQVMHHDLPILGYRMSASDSVLVYITDMKTIDSEEIPYAKDADVLVVNALRHTPHHSHQTVEEAVNFARLVGAPKTWLIHTSHDIGRHAEVNTQLPPAIQLAYDGQVVEL